MKMLASLLLLVFATTGLSGCIAAAASAGAAGGYYVEKHYKIEKKDTNTKQTSQDNKN